MSKPEQDASGPVLAGLTCGGAPDPSSAALEWIDTELTAALFALGGFEMAVLDCSLASWAGGTKVAPPFHGVVTAFAPYPALCEVLGAAQEAGQIDGWAAFGGVESRRFDRVAPGAASGPARAIKRISLHRSIPGLSIDDYRSHFSAHFIITRDHMPLAWRYRQTDVAHQAGPLAFRVDGISEFWLENLDALSDIYGGDAANKAAVSADSRLFVDAATSVTIGGYESARHPAG